MMKRFPLTACLMVALAVSACSSSKKSKVATNAGNGPKLEQRLGKWDLSKRSSFDKHRSATGINKDYKTGLFRRKKYSGKKEFKSGRNGFKTSTFSQADKKSRVADKTFSGAGNKSRMGESKFKTSESRYSSQENRNGSQRSAMEGDVFKTRENPMTKKAMASNKRPYIEETQKPGYTEAQVKGLLNKP